LTGNPLTSDQKVPRSTTLTKLHQENRLLRLKNHHFYLWNQ